MKLYLIQALLKKVVNEYEEGLTSSKLVSSKELEDKKEVLGAYTDKAIAEYIVEKYCKPNTTCEVLNSNESGTVWKEQETSKTYAVQAFDTEKEKATVYHIPNAYDVLYFGEQHTAVDQTRFIPGKTFEQIAAEVQNVKEK